MDTTTTYRNIVKQVILHYARLRPSHGNIRLDVVFDETRDRYALMQAGWDRGRRVRGNLIYVTLHDEKVYVAPLAARKREIRVAVPQASLS